MSRSDILVGTPWRGGARMSARGVVATLLALVTLVLPASSATGATRAALTYVTPVVSPGGVVSVRASAAPGSTCSVSLVPPGFDVPILIGVRLLRAHQDLWHYRLSPKASDGEWHVRLACRPGGGATRAFRVGPPPVAPAQIEVGKTGFYDQTYSSSSTSFLSCGVELTNVSTSDARDLTVTVSFDDTQGRSVATTQTTLALIPAGQTFWMSCLDAVAVTLSVASMNVQVQVGQSTAHTGRLPVVSSVTLATNTSGLFSTETLTGSLTNTYATPLSPDATIYAVYYDAAGNFVGSDSTSTGAAVEPGATVGFSFSYVPTTATSAEVSVDPCGFTAGLASCQLP